MEGEVTFTQSGILTRNHKKWICVRFERNSGNRTDFAEGKVPECKIDQQKGFSAEEIRQLEEYLEAEKEHIISEARKLNHITNLLS